MSYYPDDHPAFDMPEFNPEPDERVVEFPVEPDIFFYLGVRMERAPGGWKCPHGRVWGGGSAERAVRSCLNECDDDEGYDSSDPKHPAYHSTHADIWDQREGK